MRLLRFLFGIPKFLFFVAVLLASMAVLAVLLPDPKRSSERRRG